MAKGKTTRITVDLTPSQYKTLQTLKRTLEAASKAQVLRQGLKLLDRALHHGVGDIHLTDEQGSTSVRLILS